MKTLSTQEWLQELAQLKPTGAFVGASWAVLGIGVLSFLIGLWNADTLARSEKGYYLAVLALGLYAAISLQKTLRDQHDGLPVSAMYYGISWGAFALAVLLAVVGLWNAELQLSEKGFYGLAFSQSLFAVLAIQKNTRDATHVDELLDKYEDNRYVNDGE